MYKEKVKVAKVEKILKRMQNGVYADQSSLMYAMLDVLCADKEEIKAYSHHWSINYNFSTDNFDQSSDLKIFLKGIRSEMAENNFGIKAR